MRKAADAAWPNIQWISDGDLLLGAHAHGDKPALRAKDGVVVAVDGDVAAYESLARTRALPRPEILADYGVSLRWDGSRREFVVCADLAGAFPFFFFFLEDCIFFSSLQHVLGSALAAPTDIVGVLEVARFGYTIGARSCFAGVRRLQPGQRLQYRIGHVIELTERSCLWTRASKIMHGSKGRDPWPVLLEATKRRAPRNSDITLMMSAGWDSRTLLALTGSALGFDRLRAYSHGDLESRELRIAREVTRSLQVPHEVQPIDRRIYDEALVERAFRRSENLVFLHWTRAGALLADRASSVALSGVYGGLLGGHYGPPSIMDGLRKSWIVLSLLSMGSMTSKWCLPSDVECVRRLLHLPDRGARPWYIDPDVVSHEDYSRLVNQDIDSFLERLLSRGVGDPTQLLEAYLIETKAAQYMNGQNLSLRAHVDVFNPFCDPNVLELAANLPLAAKIHNRINHRILRKYDKALLGLPLAATLVSARNPLLIQEASRLMRKMREERAWKRHFSSRLRIGRPRLGWLDSEWLRDGKTLSRIIDRLQSDIWDRPALTRRVSEIARGDVQHPLHSFFDQFGKIMTVDRIVAGR